MLFFTLEIFFQRRVEVLRVVLCECARAHKNQLGQALKTLIWTWTDNEHLDPLFRDWLRPLLKAHLCVCVCVPFCSSCRYMSDLHVCVCILKGLTMFNKTNKLLVTYFIESFVISTKCHKKIAYKTQLTHKCECRIKYISCNYLQSCSAPQPPPPEMHASANITSPPMSRPLYWQLPIISIKSFVFLITFIDGLGS